MILGLYRTATSLAGPLVRIYLAGRRRRGKEDPARFGERLGKAGRPRPRGPLVWIHGASVGEAISFLPLVERIRSERPDWTVLVTTGTVTSARILAARLPDGAVHQFVPVDRSVYVRRFLDHWKPDLVLWAESEFWPNLICGIAGRGTPLVLVNGRVSARSFKGWSRFKGLIVALLSRFRLCLGQTQGDAERLTRLGAPLAKCVGNLKFAAPPLPADGRELETLSGLLGERPRWLAASTHPGEEEIIARVHGRLKDRFPGLLTVIVPRHPERGAEIAATLRRSGLNLALRSAGDPVDAKTEIYVADTLGELGLFYRLIEIVFMGKSLVPLGGQNLLEPARLDCVLVHGPHMGNFAEIVALMKQAGASVEAAGEEDLAEKIERLLNDADERAALAKKAKETAAAQAGVLDRVMAELAPYFEEAAHARP